MARRLRDETGLRRPVPSIREAPSAFGPRSITRGGLRSVLRERRDIVPRALRRARRRIDRLRRAFPSLFRLPAPVLGRVDGRLCVFVSARALLERRGPRLPRVRLARVRLDVHQERLALRRACSVGVGARRSGARASRGSRRPVASRVPLGRNSSGAEDATTHCTNASTRSLVSSSFATHEANRSTSHPRPAETFSASHRTRLSDASSGPSSAKRSSSSSEDDIPRVRGDVRSGRPRCARFVSETRRSIFGVERLPRFESKHKQDERVVNETEDSTLFHPFARTAGPGSRAAPVDALSDALDLSVAHDHPAVYVHDVRQHSRTTWSSPRRGRRSRSLARKAFLILAMSASTSPRPPATPPGPRTPSGAARTLFQLPRGLVVRRAARHIRQSREPIQRLGVPVSARPQSRSRRAPRQRRRRCFF